MSFIHITKGGDKKVHLEQRSLQDYKKKPLAQKNPYQAAQQKNTFIKSSSKSENQLYAAVVKPVDYADELLLSDLDILFKK